MKTKKHSILILLFSIIGTTLATRAATVPVDIVNFSFSPDPITINVGDSVAWKQHDTANHTVTSGTSPTPNGLFNSGNLGTGQTYTHTFTSAGNFPYFSIPDGSPMSGTVIVNGSPANNPPIVSITSPASGSSFTAPASITISASASDADGTVSFVEFFDNGASLGIKTSSPYTMSVSLVAGAHALTAKATDNKGASTTSVPVNITVNPPANNPPTVSITQPADNSNIPAPGNVTLQATANDSDGSVTRVEYFDGNTSLGSATSSPYSVGVTLAPGTHAIRAVATDNHGLTAPSPNITVTVSTVATPPTVTLTSPNDGATLAAPASVTFHATANSSGGFISKIEVFANGNLVGTGTASPFDLVLNNLAAGTYNFTAKATDNQGLAGSSGNITVRVTASVTPPTITLTGPTNGAALIAPANITLHATANSSGGSISKIEIFSNGNSVGAGNASPYDLLLSNVGVGNYAFTAKATDSQGTSTTSSTINVNVIPSTTQPPKLVSPGRLADGKVTFIVQGTEGTTYSVEAATDLSVWTSLGTVTISGGSAPFTDTTAGALPFRFYRAVKR